MEDETVSDKEAVTETAAETGNRSAAASLPELLKSSQHAILFFGGFFFFNKGLQIIDLSKTSIIQYSKIVFVFILGTIFLGQKVFFSDILGSSIIVGFMIYHVLNPVK